MLRRLIAFSLLAPSLLPAFGQGTRLWTQSRYDEFEKGRAQGVAILSNGSIEPGPALHTLVTTPSSYAWAIAADRQGNAYVGTGSPATVLKITPDGKTTTLFESKDLGVQALRLGPDGALYAATLPSGKVYRLGTGAAISESAATVVFDPSATDAKPKYVWDLAFDDAGRIYIAAGAPAGIYRVNPAQTGVPAGTKPELFFKSDEQHIRCLAFTRDGSLIAGSDGSGLIYRIGKDGKGFVLYDAPKREITSVAVGDDGSIYAAGVGEKSRNPLPPLPVQGNATVTATITVLQPGSVQAFNGNSVIPDGSEVYQLTAEGAPRKLWSSRDDIVYALRATPQGLLAASGNRGRIYRIQQNGDYADVAHLEASQVTGFADAPHGFYVSTANTGQVYSLDTAPDANATYLSDVFDAGVFSRWGAAEVQTPPGASYELFVRTGNVENPERSWSDWRPVTAAHGDAGAPSARFIQWKAVLHSGASIESVGLNYLPVNVAPSVDEVVIATGARVNPQQQAPPSQTVNIVFQSAQNSGISFPENSAAGPLSAQKDKTAVTVRWLAHDDNGDDLVFSLYDRGENDTGWRLLKDEITDRYYSFDAALLPDGAYRVRVVASDAPSHNPGEALTSDKVSDSFLLDATPPVIRNLTAALQGNALHVALDAEDALSPIAHAEYSVDSGPWQYVEPVGKLSDARQEHYDFTAAIKDKDKGAPGHIVTVRVYDRYDNVTAARAIAH